MSRKSRLQDAREAKDKRMKKVAIGGIVVLAAVLAFEVPKVMHLGGKASSSPPPATTTTPGTGVSTPPQTTAPGTAAAATLTPSGTPTALPNSDAAPNRSKSQLFSFSHFAGKDPFVAQVATATQSGPDSTDSATTGSSSSSSGASGGTSSKNRNVPIDTTAARSLATTGTARISVNGRIQTVRVGKIFPSANPLFRLVSISRGVVRIAIAHGSYSSGAQTVTLTAGKSLTLVDTADGTRYKLRLLAA
jgi:hypothetical protein